MLVWISVLVGVFRACCLLHSGHSVVFLFESRDSGSAWVSPHKHFTFCGRELLAGLAGVADAALRLEEPQRSASFHVDIATFTTCHFSVTAVSFTSKCQSSVLNKPKQLFSILNMQDLSLPLQFVYSVSTCKTMSAMLKLKEFRDILLFIWNRADWSLTLKWHLSVEWSLFTSQVWVTALEFFRQTCSFCPVTVKTSCRTNKSQAGDSELKKTDFSVFRCKIFCGLFSNNNEADRGWGTNK